MTDGQWQCKKHKREFKNHCKGCKLAIWKNKQLKKSGIIEWVKE